MDLTISARHVVVEAYLIDILLEIDECIEKVPRLSPPCASPSNAKMSKRKRDDDPVKLDSTISSAQQQRVQFKLKQSTAKLGHAFKAAKGSERQKLGRRRKLAASQSNAVDVRRIDAEIVALKELDNGKCAHHYLCKTLLKIKAVSESADLPDEVRSVVALSTDTATLNVHARLCKSTSVKDALPAILSELQRALGIRVVKEGLPKKRLRAQDYNDAETGKVVQTDAESGHRKRTKNGQDPEEEAPRLEASSDEGSFADFDDRMASSNNDDSDDEGSDIDVLERQLVAEGVRQKQSSKPSSSAYDLAADISLSSPDSASDSESPAPRKAPPIKHGMFVPSLSLGGYISGSGSDIDDDIDVAPPPKNRRGQRARQTIWEQKYGVKATHLSDSQKKAQQSKDQGWDMKRGATDGRDRRGRGGLGGRGGGMASRGSGFGNRGGRGTLRGGGASARQYGERDQAKKQDPKHRDDGGPIHPSWEAAKKAKEMRAKPVAFLGKKVTFD